MATNVGTVSAQLELDTRKASQQYRNFQKEVSTRARNIRGLGMITSDAKDFEAALSAATNRVTAFAAAAVVFNTVKDAVKAFAAATVEVDQSLIKINVNLNESVDGLKKFGADLFNVARQTGQNFEVAADAAEELARQGLGAEKTISRLKDSLMLARIAGIDSKDAVEALTAAVNSFQDSALSSSEVVNKFAAVDTKFAVSSRDLSEAISRVGSTAQAAGVGIDELIGLVTSLQQTTARGGATIGNGLKTIFTRIQAAPETIKALEGLGVSIKTSTGQIRPAISILKDYAQARDRVSDVEKAGLDRLIAGTFQVNILKAALADLSREYSIYGKALDVSKNATDEAIQKNQQLNESLSALINSTAVSIKQLFSAIGEQSVSPFIKDVLTSIEKLRKYFSGESGDQMGEYLGQGILKGITKILTGPALVGLVVVLGKAFRKIGETIFQEVKALVSINNELAVRERIEQKIVTLLRQATQAEAEEYAAATSVLEQRAALLAIEQRITAERLQGSELARAILQKQTIGPLTRYSGGTFLKGPTPGFADPIASAIAKESQVSGLPVSQIYVGKDSRVASFANPMGLLVANRRDEPSGAFQGVNRVIAQGGNPKKGSLPNFAWTPFTSKDLPFVNKKTLDKINEGFRSALRQETMKGFLSEMAPITEMSMSKKLPKASSEKLQKEIADVSSKRLVTERMRQKNAEISLAAEQANIRQEKLQERLKKAQVKTAERKQASEQKQLRENEKLATTQARAEQRAKEAAIKRQQVETDKLAKTKEREAKREIELAEKQKRIEAKNNEKAINEQLKAVERENKAKERLAAKQEREQQKVLNAQIRTQEKEAKARERQAEKTARNYEKQEKARLKQQAIEQKVLDKQNAVLLVSQQQQRGKEERKKQLEIDKERNAKIVAEQERKQKLSNRIFMSSFLFGLSGGFIPTDSKNAPGGTVKGGLFGAASGAAQGASIGGLTGTPQGLAAGAVIGGLVGAFEKLRKTTEEITEPLQKEIDERNQASQALQNYIQIQSQINDLRDQGGDPATIQKLQQARNELLAKLDSNFSQKIIDAGQNIDALNRISIDYAKSIDGLSVKTKALREILNNLRSGVIPMFEPEGIKDEDARKLGRELGSQLGDKFDLSFLREFAQKYKGLSNVGQEFGAVGVTGGAKLGGAAFPNAVRDLRKLQDQFNILGETVPELNDNFLVTGKNAEKASMALFNLAIGAEEARKQQKQQGGQDFERAIQLREQRAFGTEQANEQIRAVREGILQRQQINSGMLSKMAGMIQSPQEAIQTTTGMNISNIKFEETKKMFDLSEEFAKQLRQELNKADIGEDFALKISKIFNFDEMVRAAEEYGKQNEKNLKLDNQIAKVREKQRQQVALLKNQTDQMIKTETARGEAEEKILMLTMKLNAFKGAPLEGVERFGAFGKQMRNAGYMGRTPRLAAEQKGEYLKIYEELESLGVPLSKSSQERKLGLSRETRLQSVYQTGRRFLEQYLVAPFGNETGPDKFSIKGALKRFSTTSQNQDVKNVAEELSKVITALEDTKTELPKQYNAVDELRKLLEDQRGLVEQNAENYNKIAKAMQTGDRKIIVELLGQLQLESNILSPQVLQSIQQSIIDNMLPIIEQRIKEEQEKLKGNPTPPSTPQGNQNKVISTTR